MSLYSFNPRVTVTFLIRKLGACLLNKHQEWRQDSGVMREERLYTVVRDEYTCCLRGAIMDRMQRECMNSFRIFG